MAFDGTTIHALCHELNEKLASGRLSKIAQPAADDMLFTIKANGGNYKLLASANASLPLLYLTEENRQSPITAPNFCMLLRKHISNGRIIVIEQMGFERVIRMRIEHLDEMGDLKEKFLYIELMGKHSNIIFTDDNDHIIDAIKHVGGNMSSVRLVLPGQDYFIPAQEGRLDPLTVDKDTFTERIKSSACTVEKALTSTYIGFGKAVAQEIAFRAGIEADRPVEASISGDNDSIDKLSDALYTAFSDLMQSIKDNEYKPEIRLNDNGTPLEYAAFILTHYRELPAREYDSISALLYDYYSEKNKYENRRAKTLDLKKNVQILLERNEKKLAIQKKQLKDTDKMDTYRVRGELLHTYGYSAEPGADKITVDNYYTNEKLTIPLDPTLSATENARKYFDRYEKLKRTKASVTEQIEETERAVAQLSSIIVALDMVDTEADIEVIRQELSDYGYMKKKSGKKKASVGKSKPICYRTSDGFTIYVGRNNYQNDELTFKIATGNDWWFHAKQIPGSHVILKTEGREVPDHVFEIAASVAAYYSSGKDSEKLEIDYVQKKEIKKPAKAVAGFVVYYTNYSMTVHPSIDEVTEIK